MTKKKHILFVMDGLKIGGVESALISVFHYFDFEKIDVDLLLLHEALDLINELPENICVFHLEKVFSSGRGVKFYFYWLLYKIFAVLHFSSLMKHYSYKIQNSLSETRAKQILPIQYETVIAYKHGEAENFVAFCIKAKNKVLFYHHGSIIDDNLHKRTMRNFQKIVAVSEGVKDLLAESYPEIKKKLTVIPNYIDSEYIRFKSRQYSIERPKISLVLCTVGRLSSEKNQLLALQAASELKRRKMNFVWYFIGEGDDRIKLEIYTRENNLQENIIFTGALNNPLPYVVICNVYVQTSLVESYGLAIQEALILGRPVVSTKTIGGMLLLNGRQNCELVEQNYIDVVKAIVSCQGNKTEEQDYLWLDKDHETKRLWNELLCL